MIGIHAEATPPGNTGVAGYRDLILVAGGPVEELAPLVRHVEALTPLFKPSEKTHGVPGAIVTALTWSAVVQLSNTFGPAFIQGPVLQAYVAEQLQRRTEALPATFPYWLDRQLGERGLKARDYQVAGAYEIGRTGRAMIFDEPRTGKTPTTILGLQLWCDADDVFKQAVNLPILVVCPASVVDPWVEHFETWAPQWRTVAWRGPKRREKFVGPKGEPLFDVYVTSYNTATTDATSVNTTKNNNPLIRMLERAGGGSLVIDECHYIKNQTSARSKAVRRIAERAGGPSGYQTAFVALSGTPITHHPGDLWPTLYSLDPPAQPSRERFSQRHLHTTRPDYGEEEVLGLHPGMEAEFRTTIIGQHRRVARADVMGQLPPKTHSTRTVDMPAAWRKVYDDFEAEMLAELPDGQELSVMDTLSVLSHLSSLASSACDVRVEYGPDVYAEGHPDEGEPKRHVHLDLKAPSWKVDALLEIAEERRTVKGTETGTEPMVVYAVRKELANLAGAALAAAGHKVGYIVGGQSDKVRTANRIAFQGAPGQAPTLDVIVATTGAGGTGITLSRAETLVFLQRPWALVDMIQSEDRGEGFLPDGSIPVRGTEIIDIVTRGTVESRVRAVLKERAGQLADLLQDQRIVRELLGGSNVVELAERRSA